ncbi:MAG: alpha/beta hydrolase [Candidatus Tectomicrobia bacterium]|nr:alpha/beta hydrolase [Candidatus Tectomicrobia bacterium]
MANAALDDLIALLTSRERPENPTVEDMRLGFDLLGKKFSASASVQVEAVEANGVPAEWVVAAGTEAERVILYLHGGGYVIGSPATHRGLAERLSRAAAARVLVIDYRLAPEHPFPAAVEDATAAYGWLLESGIKADEIAVAGDSAGGGLTVSTLVALRDAGQPVPAAGVCESPWVDMEGIGKSMTARAGLDPMVQKDGLIGMANLYLNGADPRTPLAAPLYADLQGLPPLLIQVGTSETLFDDATRLAERGKAAGVEVALEPWDDMIHVWQLFASVLPEGQKAIDRIGEFVRQHAA